MALKAKAKYKGKAVVLYEPENISHIKDKFSNWRKSDRPYAHDRRALIKYNALLKRLINISYITSVVLSIFIFVSIAYLIGFANFEKTVLSDGTYLSCVVGNDGKIGVKF